MAAAEGSAKKRKRNSDNTEKPRKKTAVNGVDTSGSSSNPSPSTKESKIKVKHISHNDVWAPVIVSSPGLSISPKVSFAPYQSRKTNELLLHSSDHHRLDYTARENQDGGLEGHLKHYIAVYDPEKKEAKVVEARYMSVRSTLRDDEEAEEEEEQDKDVGGSGTNYFQLRSRLGLEFGNKKTKQSIRSVAQNAIKTIKDPVAAAASPEAMKQAIRANPAAAAVLESMAEAAEAAPVKEDLQAAIDDAKPRPKHNPDARQAKDHYVASQLIGDDIFKAIKVKPWFDAIDSGESVETPPSHFVSNRLKSIVDANLDDAVMKVRVLKWMLMLIRFYLAGKRVRGGAFKLPKKEEVLRQVGEDSMLVDAIRKQFAPSGGEMTKWHVDLLMSHLAVMSLIVDDFKTNTNDLMVDLRLEPKQLALYFREIGAKVNEMNESERARAKLGKVEARQHKIAKLEDELDFPQIRAPMPGRRR